MTHPYTKLADALDFVCRAHVSDDYPSDQEPLAEAARILRAAASVDVAGLMAKAMMLVSALDCACKQKSSEPFNEAVAALESALRMALAAREGFVMVPVEPTPEMLFNAEMSDARGYSELYRAMLAAAPKGTP